MENFFARMEPWRKREGALHLYVLPSDDDVERFTAAREALSDIEHLPLMPEPYLHCTVQRLAQFDDEVTQPDLTRLGTILDETCSTLPAFTLELGPARAGEVAVESWAAPSPDWDVLVEASRSSVTQAWDTPPPAAPAGPHLSLAYATDPVPHDLVDARLAALGPLGTLRVDTLHLVSVTVRPERGTFDFTSLANWELTGPPRT